MNLKCPISSSPQAGNHLNGFVSRPKDLMSQVLKLNGGGNVVSLSQASSMKFLLILYKYRQDGGVAMLSADLRRSIFC